MINRSMMKPVLVLTAMLVMLICCYPASAQKAEQLQLQRKIEDLEAKIQVLESRLKELETSSVTPTNPDYGWQNKKNWRSLKVGMREDEVKKILGEPVKLIQGVRTLWYYPNFYCGYVSFDSKGYLIGWNEP